MKTFPIQRAAACLLLLVGAGAGAARPAVAAADVVTTTPELAAIAREVGGNLVRVTSLAKPDQDYHRIEARPSDVTRIARADLFVRVGMDLDMWADALTNAARNPKVQRGGAGYVDASRMIRKIEVPSERITGASGDVHPAGNPHYYLDPGNGKVIAYQILLGLRRVDARNGNAYNANYKRFTDEIDRRMEGWRRALAPYKGKSVVAYHAEWPYFLDRFDLRAFGYLEPRPGVPPSGAHVNNLMQRMKASGVRAVIVPSIYPNRYPNMVARSTGGEVGVTPYSVGSLGTRTYFEYIDAIVNAFRKALG
jgi:ABC-type Zn uptake system ZnuABC Zn-binding protein ZnuA